MKKGVYGLFKLLNISYKKNMLKILIIIILILCALIGIMMLSINFYVVNKTKSKIVTEKQAKELENVDCILVLGAGIWGDKPSPMLEDRLLQGITLYNNQTSSKIIMSGDHGKEEYDEVNVMKDFAIEKGVKSEDIFMDHAGFSTYDSVYRAKEIFKAQKIIIVTQKYHLHRALYVAEKLGIEAYGVASNPREYRGQVVRELREVLARDKDFFKCIIKPEPTYLGDTIPVSGNGDATNDKKGGF